MADKCLNCVVVAAGKYHDIDFARCELLKLLNVHPNIRTRVFEDYENLEALEQADLLITYTCDVIPSLDAQKFMQRWLKQGGRWLALHGTNSILQLDEEGLWQTPRVAPLFMKMLGSQFLSHPPIEPYWVRNVAPEHPLVANIDNFEVADELYHMEIHGPIETLLDCECSAPGRGFAEGDAAKGIHPVLYRKEHEAGEVLYFTLGHCRGHYDLRPLKDYVPELDRGAWEIPQFKELVCRSIAWLTNRS